MYRQWTQRGEFQDEPESPESVGSISSHSDSDGTGAPTGEEDMRLSNTRSSLKEVLEARKEETSKAVRYLPCMIMVVLVVTAIVVAVAVYTAMRNDEKGTFEDQFYNLADRLVEGFHVNAKLQLQVMDMLSISLTAQAAATEQIWPFVTIKNFEAQATAARSILGSDHIGVYPYVPQDLRRPWEQYTQLHNNLQWINESVAYQNAFLETHNRSSSVTRRQSRTRNLLTSFTIDYQSDNGTNIAVLDISNNASHDGVYGTNPHIFRAGDPDNPADDGVWVNVIWDAPGPFYPTWQFSPAAEDIAIATINYNIVDFPGKIKSAFSVVQETGEAVFGRVWDENNDKFDVDDDGTAPPSASLMYPVFDMIEPDTEAGKSVAAIMELGFEFGPFFASVLPPTAGPISAVVSNCDQFFTFEVTGETALYMGPGDLHDLSYDSYMVSTAMADLDSSGGTVYNGVPVNNDNCPWKLQVYPTREMENQYLTPDPVNYMIVILGAFVFSCLILIVYNCISEHQQEKAAVKSNNAVSTLVLQSFKEILALSTNDKQPSAKSIQKSLQDDKVSDRLSFVADPQLYQNCTVFFAEIAGFAAWSSARSPAKIFALLDTLYGAFDKLVDRHRVYKIDTTGDCYVCVTGLPQPQPNHALIMVRFARDCLGKATQLLTELEANLGPGTSELAVRIGLNSGPVAAGFLTGKKASSRLQMLGDTVVTAAEMGSTGQRDRIHATQDTADNLTAMGKSHWVYKREEPIIAQGKGELPRYWIRPTAYKRAKSDLTSATDDRVFDVIVQVEGALAGRYGSDMDKMKWAEENFRGIGWTADLLFKELKWVIVERRDSSLQENQAVVWSYEDFSGSAVVWDDRLCESLFDLGDSSWHEEETIVQFRGGKVEDQLKIFVTCLAYNYNETAFHKYSHASQVLLAADNMLEQLSTSLGKERQLNAWAKFVVLLAAIIRDLDPTHSDNQQHLAIDENPSEDVFPSAFATRHKSDYKPSLQKAWELLLDERLVSLRMCLCANREEFYCFRQLLVNLVVGADMTSTSYAIQREFRWENAFNGRSVPPRGLHVNPSSLPGSNAWVYSSDDDDHDHEDDTEPSNQQITNEQAASILEHISLAAQFTHTMQHWDLFKKWNARLYQELCNDFERGVLNTDPSRYWYKQELAMFDQVIIPLAEKLQLPYVLGAMGSEYLKFALNNRREWKFNHQFLAQSSSCVEHES